MRHRVRGVQPPYACLRRARLARNYGFGSFRQARLRPALSFVWASFCVQAKQPNMLKSSRASLVRVDTGYQTRYSTCILIGCFYVHVICVTTP